MIAVVAHRILKGIVPAAVGEPLGEGEECGLAGQLDLRGGQGHRAGIDVVEAFGPTGAGHHAPAVMVEGLDDLAAKLGASRVGDPAGPLAGLGRRLGGPSEVGGERVGEDHVRSDGGPANEIAFSDADRCGLEGPIAQVNADIVDFARGEVGGEQ